MMVQLWECAPSLEHLKNMKIATANSIYC